MKEFDADFWSALLVGWVSSNLLIVVLGPEFAGRSFLIFGDCTVAIAGLVLILVKQRER